MPEGIPFYICICSFEIVMHVQRNNAVQILAGVIAMVERNHMCLDQGV